MSQSATSRSTWIWSEHEARAQVRRGRLRGLHAFLQASRQLLPSTDESDLHSFIDELRNLVVDLVAEEAHELLDLVRRTTPILRAEGKDRQIVDACIPRCANHPLEGLGPCGVTCRDRETTTLSPPAVAVHDDSNMAWYQVRF